MNQENQTRNIRLAVDIGGTFTDGVAVLSPGDRIWVGKTLTTPSAPGDAVTTVIVDLLRQVAAAGMDVDANVAEMVHGTTLVTNTLIERKGARTALVVTKGTRDVLLMGREGRYDMYDLNLEIPRPLVPQKLIIEVDARLDVRGNTVKALDDKVIDAMLASLADMDVEAIAVCLLHSYVNDVQERQVEAAIRKAFPKMAVSISSSIAREIREYERMSTTVCNAYVQPLVTEYLGLLADRVNDLATGAGLRIMLSSGGFTSGQAAADNPILLLESGPAGGVLSALNTARQHGINEILAFDMGGTTAKACVAVGGEPLLSHSFECSRVSRFKRGSGLPILIPSIDLIEIGAGGGSIAHINDFGLLNVGPESSGSVPGPACYAGGGTHATVTDADLFLGYLNADNFLGGTMKLRRDLAEAALQDLASEMKMTATEVAWGICSMVNENMTAAARVHIAEKGHDPRSFTMVATGGAGPVHAVEVARKLQIPKVLAPIAAGAGSCLGFLAAPARVDRSWSNPTLVADVEWQALAEVFGTMRKDAEAELASAGAPRLGLDWFIGAEMRYAGQGHNVPVTLPWQELSTGFASELIGNFEQRYRQLYGNVVPNAVPQVMTWRLTGRSPIEDHPFRWGDTRTQSRTVAPGMREIYLPLKKCFKPVPIYDRYSLMPGTRLDGPLVLEEKESTLVVPVAANVQVLEDYTILIEIKEFE
ncbi:hydantoinase/oxoprolinase family protein [Lacisediminimonas profundi]|uniref:hydantoinase/oxoprolinase family protein n=1 Tax=Lacisediminimonas profundi TaxID=2603856 RepID=UPI001F5008E5|nr:hydantoinase/oxoprolinase family protein [Lacisediminimonas profundi]